MIRKIVTFLAVAAVLGIIVLAVFRFVEAKTLAKNRKNSRKQEAIVVNVTMAERRTMQDERRFSGTAMAWSEYDISPKVSGRLIKLCYEIGDEVKRGSLIAKIDDAEYLQQQRQALANLEYAKAKQREASGIANTKHSEFERQKRLRLSNATAESTYEQAESDMVSADAALEMCKAEVKRCQSLLDNANLRLSYTTINAEWDDGTEIRHVGKRYVDDGTLLSVGTRLISIVELTRIKAYIQIIERDYPWMKAGQKAEFTTDAYPNAAFEGKIINIDNTLSDKTRSALAIVSIDNKDLRLRPGMFLRARVILDVHKDAQVLPLNAIVQKDDVQAVFRYKDGKAVFTPVVTGLVDGTHVEILRPQLKDPVVTVGNHLLDDGREIIISELSRSQMAEQEAARMRKEEAEKKAAKASPKALPQSVKEK